MTIALAGAAMRMKLLVKQYLYHIDAVSVLADGSTVPAPLQWLTIAQTLIRPSSESNRHAVVNVSDTKRSRKDTSDARAHGSWGARHAPAQT